MPDLIDGAVLLLPGVSLLKSAVRRLLNVRLSGSIEKREVREVVDCELRCKWFFCNFLPLLGGLVTGRHCVSRPALCEESEVAMLC